MEQTPTSKIPRPGLTRKRKLQNQLEHVTQEMYLRNKELAETNKTLALLGTIDALALEANATLKSVCEHITEATVQAAGFTFVGLMARVSHNRDELVLSGWSGSEWLGKDKNLDFSRPLHLKLTNKWFSELEATAILPVSKLSDKVIANYFDCPPGDVKRIRKQLDIEYMYVVKLMSRRRLVGLLVVGFSDESAQISEADIKLLDRLSESIGVALDNKLLFEENQHVLRQLRESNAKLKALDEAKDDFISMASHQLRTPLTSVKGYVSMVMEGDAGKITPKQKDMLGQAYFSSQRMVYLIADLLNVSRLRTGKFIIEPVPVNLAKLIDEELEQLKETAKSRSLTLTFKPPKSFPDLMLDETKIRQVIMNFADNAIYYTPNGGHITVKLIESNSTVELKIEDDGIGVPKSEQHHLFTKFYRAGNARKARPDGTGLGLFMAKKVVVAQGGSIIFESKEGKGSTFGFMFSKAKLAVAAKPAK